MKTTSYSTKFFINEAKASASGVPIYARIIVNRKKADLSLNEFVEKASDWNQEKQEAKGKKYQNLNLELTAIRNKLNEIRRNLLHDDKEITAPIIKNIYQGKTDRNTSLLSFCDSYIEEARKTRKYGTVKNFIATKNHLQRFLISRNKEDLSVKAFSLEDVSLFDTFLTTEPVKAGDKPMIRNSANKYHKKLKTILNKAILLNYISKNPYDGFKINNERTKRICLTDDEIERIKVHNLFDTPRLLRVRDIFLFSVYTGLRYSDVFSLKKKEIIQNKEGEYWLNKEQIKTEDLVETMLIGDAVSIYLKYKDLQPADENLFPEITNQKLNMYLKEIAELCNIDKNLTHHVARHTCATMLLSKGMTLETVSHMLGHKSVRTTQVYAKMTPNRLRDELKTVERKL